MKLLSAEIISNDYFKITTSSKIKLCPYYSKLAITVTLVTVAPHITVQELNRLNNKCMLHNIQNLDSIYACNLQATKTFFFQCKAWLLWATFILGLQSLVFGMTKWFRWLTNSIQERKCQNILFVHLAFLQFFWAFQRVTFLKCILAWKCYTNKAFRTVNIWVCFSGGILPINFHAEENQSSVLPSWSFHLKCSSHLTYSCLSD